MAARTQVMGDTLSRAKERLRVYAGSLKPARIAGRFDGPVIFANSVPKSGTNLLTECLSLFPSLRPSFEHVSMNSNRRSGTAELERKVASTKSGQYTSGHAFHTDDNRDILADHDVRSILIVRDPRDVVTSHFHYVTEKNTSHRLTEHYRGLADDEARLMASIRGVDDEHTADGDPLESIGEWMEAFGGWRREPFNVIVRFEDLIGPKGGGDRERQKETVRRIGDHLDVDLDADTVEYVAQNTFSTDSETFRKGLIGDWTNHFTDDHVEAFKAEAGEWLVELGYEDDLDWTAASADVTPARTVTEDAR